MKNYPILLTLFLSIIYSCQPSIKELRIEAVQMPENNDGALPNLFTDAKDQVFLTWVKEEEDESHLLLSEWKGLEWSSPEIISSGSNWFVNWADFPSFIAGPNFKAAHWLQKSAEGTYDYDVKVVTQQNEQTWSSPFKLHKDRVNAEHGFVSMLPLSNERFFATWLDGRFTKTGGHDHSSQTGAMTLRAGFFKLNGEAEALWELDNRTCDCCQTAAVMGTDGPIVVYRDRSESEIRDIYITKYVKEKWTAPMPVANDLWEIAGCPVNGPDIALAGKHLAVVWYSGSGNTPKVQLSISNDQGSTFSAPKLLAEGNTIGRVGISGFGENQFAVTWMESKNDDALIKLGIFDQTGARLTSKVLSSTSLSRASGFPTITSSGSNLFVSWTDTSENEMIKMIRATYE